METKAPNYTDTKMEKVINKEEGGANKFFACSIVFYLVVRHFFIPIFTNYSHFPS